MNLLHDLVSIYSPSRHEREAVSFLVDWMNDNGYAATIDEAGNAVGMRGSGENLLIWLGHIDTVDGEIPVRVEDGLLYGRGSVDAKGSLCAFTEAAAQAEIPANWRVMVVGAVEEEIATSNGAKYIRDHYQPDMCIIGEPSGAERITLGYKGRLLVDVELSQPIAHSARPEASVGSIGSDFWQTVNEWVTEINQERERYFDQVFAQLRSINTDSDGFCETVHMTLGFRLPPDYSPETVFEQVQALASLDASLRPYSMERAYQGNKNNALVRGMLKAIRQQGHRPNFVLKTGTSDMNVVGATWNCPIIAYGPGDSNLDHTPNEHISLDEYQQAVATLRSFIKGLD
ncbi:MAG: [LysW]-lysine hydrolase [Chloroflexi bacterium]|nr:[LysW]-lysine hydrolase [Chloroflexota bacterium]